MILTCKILAVISLATYILSFATYSRMNFEPEEQPPSKAMVIFSILNILNIFSNLALCLAIQFI